MDEKQRAEVFSAAVDRMLGGDELVDFEASSSEMNDLLALADCLVENRYTPSKPSFQDELERFLLRQMRQGQQKGEENSILNRIRVLFVPLRLRWRIVLLGSLIVLALGIGFLLVNPTVRAQIRQWLQWTTVREVEGTPSWQINLDYPSYPIPGPLEEVQARVDFHILQPDHLPDGYGFCEVTAHNFEEFAQGVTVVLLYCYQGDCRTYTEVCIEIHEFRARRRINEAIAPGYSREVEVNGRQALYVSGGWEFDDKGRPTEWKEGGLERLLFEVDDTVVWIYAMPPVGVEELIKVTESFQ